MDRRKFFKQSFFVSGGFILAPLYVSCSDEDMAFETQTSMDTGDFKFQNFNQGVASFDPTDSSIIIWTRFEGETIDVIINWELATDANFQNLVKKGTIQAQKEFDYTLNLDVEGLSSNSKFYYRFYEESTKSITKVGETITLPNSTDAIAQVKLAVASCADYTKGFFNVYDAIANSDVDIVIHLGDYIYESAQNEEVVIASRTHNPLNEAISLEDYRERYKQYRSDKNLQLAHQKKPFICVWDDHEISGNAYSDGAANHQKDEGNFETRKQVAIQAYSEYIPIRTNDSLIIYRSFNFGNLLTLHMLDTRITGRNQQYNFEDFLNIIGALDYKKYQLALADVNQNMLGDRQFSWFSGVLNNSSAWQVIGQQVLMAKMHLPLELLNFVSQVTRNGKPTAIQTQNFQTSVNELIAIKFRISIGDPSVTSEESLRINTVAPYNLDAWDGYGVEREKLFSLFEGKKVISLAGDSHNAWYSNLTNTSGTIVATELATASVTSSGFDRITNNVSELAGIKVALETLIDDLNYMNPSKRGFLKVTFTSASAEANWYFLDTITNENYTVELGKSTTIT